jgi:hypothetical protein
VARGVLALLAAHVGVAGAVALLRSARHLREDAHHLGEDPAVGRRRVFGAGYVAAIEGIRRAVPADGAYLLVDAQESEEGALYWVRFDLAPRRALLVGRTDEPEVVEELRRVRGKGLQQVVVVYGGGRAPELVRRGALLRQLRGAP